MAADTLDNKYVVFNLNDEFYGLPISKVKAIEKMSVTTRIPNAPFFVRGVMNLRGDVITVLDLRSRLNIPTKEPDFSSRTIVVMEGDLTVGLVVDSSSEVLVINPENIDSANIATSMDSGINDYISGIGKTFDGRLVIILELSKILGN